MANKLLLNFLHKGRLLDASGRQILTESDGGCKGCCCPDGCPDASSYAASGWDGTFDFVNGGVHSDDGDFDPPFTPFDGVIPSGAPDFCYNISNNSIPSVVGKILRVDEITLDCTNPYGWNIQFEFVAFATPIVIFYIKDSPNSSDVTGTYVHYLGVIGTPCPPGFICTFPPTITIS